MQGNWRGEDGGDGVGEGAGSQLTCGVTAYYTILYRLQGSI